jgi:DNA-binding ferritin-like protein
MIQIDEAKERFVEAEQSIHRAYQTCQASGSEVPPELVSCIEEMEQRSQETKDMLDQDTTGDQLVQCVDDLEALADRAKEACEQAPHVSDSVTQAVLQGHRQLSQLKRQLH